MVQLLPRDRLILQTPEALQTIIARLEAHVENRKTFRWAFTPRHASYEGSISTSGFKIRRISSGRSNSFIPEVEGKFQTHSGGTAVEITLKLHPFVLIFLGIWLLGWYGLTSLMWSSGSVDSLMIQLFWGLPPLMIIAFWVSFWIEVERTKKDLFRIILEQPTRDSQGRGLVLVILRSIILFLSTAFSLWFIAHYFFDLRPDLEILKIFQDR